MKRIPTLDGWRGIAILLVIADHCQLGLYSAHPFGLTGGHGVAIFFVLSGYLITSKLQLERGAAGSIDLKSFYIRRFFRLMPVAWLYLGLTALALSFGHLLSHPIEFLGALFFFRNYVDFPNLSPLTSHFWSLSVEEQFYLVWPPVLSALSKRRGALIAIVATSIIAIYRLSQQNVLFTLPLQASLGTQFRADALLIGCIAALILPECSRHFRSWMIWLLVALFGVCLWQFGFLIPRLNRL
jgi:peptidoglycan/LPS O-acetylase OafA/YrhL